MTKKQQVVPDHLYTFYNLRLKHLVRLSNQFAYVWRRVQHDKKLAAQLLAYVEAYDLIHNIVLEQIDPKKRHSTWCQFDQQIVDLARRNKKLRAALDLVDLWGTNAKEDDEEAEAGK